MAPTKNSIPRARRSSRCRAKRLHRGLATESLIEALLNAGPEVADVMEVPCSEGDRRLLAAILLKEDEELSAERLEGAVGPAPHPLAAPPGANPARTADKPESPTIRCSGTNCCWKRIA